MAAHMMTISEVAALRSCSVHTLRYYEKAGLLPPVARAGNGHRAYSPDDVEWVDFLFCLRETGMPIAEMKRYVDLVAGGNRTAPERLRLLKEHRATVMRQVETLQHHLQFLDHKIQAYRQGIAEAIAAEQRDGAHTAPP